MAGVRGRTREVVVWKIGPVSTAHIRDATVSHRGAEQGAAHHAPLWAGTGLASSCPRVVPLTYSLPPLEPAPLGFADCCRVPWECPEEPEAPSGCTFSECTDANANCCTTAAEEPTCTKVDDRRSFPLKLPFLLPKYPVLLPFLHPDRAPPPSTPSAASQTTHLKRG